MTNADVSHFPARDTLKKSVKLIPVGQFPTLHVDQIQHPWCMQIFHGNVEHFFLAKNKKCDTIHKHESFMVSTSLTTKGNKYHWTFALVE